MEIKITVGIDERTASILEGLIEAVKDLAEAKAKEVVTNPTVIKTRDKKEVKVEPVEEVREVKVEPVEEVKEVEVIPKEEVIFTSARVREALVKIKYSGHQDFVKDVLNHFNVKKFDQLTQEQYPEVMKLIEDGGLND